MTANDLILQWIVAALVGALLLARGRLSLLHPATLYLAFHVVAFCLRPTILVAAGLDDTWQGLLASPEPEDLRRALWVSSAGLVSFTLAFMAATFRRGPSTSTGPAELDATEKRALLATAALFAIPGLAGVVLSLSSTQHSGYLIDLPLVLLPLALLAVLAAGLRWWSLLPVAGLAWARSIPGSAGAIVPAACLLVVLLWLWNHQRRLPSLLFILASAGALFAAGVLTDENSRLKDWFSGRETPSAAASTGSSMLERFDRPGWGHLEALAGVIAVVPEKSGGFSHGHQHFAAVQSMFGALSSGPGTGSGTAATIELHRIGKFRGFPLALVSDGWMSGGWGGVVVTLMLAGALLGAAWVAFAHSPDDPARACFFLPVHVLALGLYATGSFALIPQALLLAAPLVVWRLITARLRRGAAAAEERERLREERQRRRVLGTALLNPNAADLPPEALAGGGSAGPDTGDADTSPEPPAAPAADETNTPPPSRNHPPARWRETDSR
jgi:hypothetical protein